MPTKPLLHLDADTSSKTLAKMLRERGHNVTRTPNEWVPEDADDEVQIREASKRGRIIFDSTAKRQKTEFLSTDSLLRFQTVRTKNSVFAVDSSLHSTSEISHRSHKQKLMLASYWLNRTHGPSPD